jgi:hypothetical protein
MAISNSHIPIVLNDDEQKIDKDLRFLERLSKCSLMIFRSNEEKPKISIPKLVLAIILLLLSRFHLLKNLFRLFFFIEGKTRKEDFLWL